METVDRHELNQNTSRAVARLRAGQSIIVTDHGRVISQGTVRPPAESGMPDVIPELADDVASLSDLVTADRHKERHR